MTVDEFLTNHELRTLKLYAEGQYTGALGGHRIRSAASENTIRRLIDGGYILCENPSRGAIIVLPKGMTAVGLKPPEQASDDEPMDRDTLQLITHLYGQVSGKWAALISELDPYGLPPAFMDGLGMMAEGMSSLKDAIVVEARKMGYEIPEEES